MNIKENIFEHNVSDELLIRIAETHLLVEATNKKIKYIESELNSLRKKLYEMSFIPISLTEQKGDFKVGNVTQKILKNNFDRIPKNLSHLIDWDTFFDNQLGDG